MKNKEFAEKNLGRIYEYNGLFVEVVGYLDDYPSVINIVRYLNPDKARGRAECWAFFDKRDKVEKGYDTPGSVYSYVLPRYLKQLCEATEVRAFAEAYKGVKFDLNDEAVTVVGYSIGEEFNSMGSSRVIVVYAGARSTVEDSDFILFNNEKKAFSYVDYRNLKPIRR